MPVDDLGDTGGSPILNECNRLISTIDFRIARYSSAIGGERRTLLDAHQSAARVTLFGCLPFSPTWPGSQTTVPLANIHEIHN